MTDTMTTPFHALRVHTIDGSPVLRFEELNLRDLDDGEVIIKTAYSGVGYRDAMAVQGIGRNMRTERPCVPGVDLSGVVESSTDPRFKKGDLVIATNYGLGASHDGGYSDYARVPADWIVPLPNGLSLRDTMALGSPGVTAALAVERLESAGLTKERGPVIVTGATGGVGSIAIDILSGRGYEVAALTGKRDAAEYLRSIGAAKIIDRSEFLAGGKTLGSPIWAGAVDCIGGEVLNVLANSMRFHGRIAVCGMASTSELNTTVFPFILRAVDFLGINVGRTFDMSGRIRMWKRLATDLKAKRLGLMVRPVPLSELSSIFADFISSKIVGRILVEIGGEPVSS